MLGRADRLFRAFEVEGLHVLEERFFILSGVFADGFLLLRGVADDFVVHVRDIHHVVEPEATLAQKPAKNVHSDKRSEVSNMSVVIDSRAAGVHANGIVRSGRKLLNLAGKRVVEMKRQAVILAKGKEWT